MGGGEKKHKRKHDVADGANEKPKDVKKDKKKKKDSKKDKDAKSPIPKFGKKVSKSKVRSTHKKKSKHGESPKENMSKSVPPTPNNGRVEEMKNRMPTANVNHRKKSARRPTEAPPVPPRSDDVPAKEMKRLPTAATKNHQTKSDKNGAKPSSNSKSSNKTKQKMLQQSPAPSTPAHSFVRPNSKEKSKNVHEYFPNPDRQTPRKNPDKKKAKKEKSSSKSKSAKNQKPGSKKHESPKMPAVKQQKSSEKLRKEVVDKEKLKDGKEKLLSHSKSSKKEKAKQLASPKNVQHDKSAEKLHHRAPKQMTPKKKERTVLINVNEVLRIGSVLERYGLDEQRRKAFEWLAEHRSEAMKDSPTVAYNLMVAIGDLTLTQELVSRVLQYLIQTGAIDKEEYRKHFAPLERSSVRLTIAQFAHLLKVYSTEFQSASELQSFIS